MSIAVHRSIFVDGQLHKEVRRATNRNRMFMYLWALEPIRRQLIHKGRKP